MVEAALPRITRAFHARERARLRQLLTRAMAIAMVFALTASTALLLLGQWIFTKLFAGRAAIDMADLLIIDGALLALTMICVSVYVQAALGRFSHLLKSSLPFLAGSLLSVPLAMLFGDWFDRGFLAIYALTMMLVAVLHALSLRRLLSEAAKR
jgi:O-antigen/teichoic acid export membrane protein